MSLLIVNADDFGLHPAIDEAILQIAEAGNITAVSVSSNGKSYNPEKVRDLSQHASIGAHITWVGEAWLTQPYRFESWKELIWRSITGGKAFQKALWEEAEAQLGLLLQAGIAIDHLDSHQHVHVFPSIWPVIQKLSKNYQISFIRCPWAHSPALMRSGISGRMLHRFAKAHRENGFHFSCAGIRLAGNYSLALLEKELSICSGQDTMLIMHPGHNNQQLNQHYGHWHFNWEQEYETLMHPDFNQLVAKYGFQLINTATATNKA
ncbi:MAG: ChbG/HpnK family deacetylase [Chitinophagales bacterium]|nr:ChbG/HpnK family deacetylase [Chitinophagales bacterium]